jgi:hypothetical protein
VARVNRAKKVQSSKFKIQSIMAKITVHLKVKTWQEFQIDIPEGKTPEAFIQELKESDPACSLQENNGISYLDSLEIPLYAEYYDETGNDLLEVHDFFN